MAQGLNCSSPDLCRLVIPGKYVDHFRQLQEENNLRGDYHLWCVDAVTGEGYQIGVKMSVSAGGDGWQAE